MHDPRPTDTRKVSSVEIRIANPEEIELRMRHKVWDWRCFDNKTGLGIKGGLFDEDIFGKEGALVCGCDKPGKEPGKKPSKEPGKERFVYRCCPQCKEPFKPARAERFGKIELKTKVAHPWFYRQNPNYIALALGDPSASSRKLEGDSRSRFELVLAGKLNVVIAPGPHAHLHIGQILDAEEVAALREEAGVSRGFRSGTGGDAIHLALANLDLPAELRRSEELLSSKTAKKKDWWRDRIALLRGFISANIRPAWMMLSVLPVAPIELRIGYGQPALDKEDRSFRTQRDLDEEIKECQDRIAIFRSLRPHAPLSSKAKRKIKLLERELVELEVEKRDGQLLRDQIRLDRTNLLLRAVIRANKDLVDATENKVPREKLQSLASKLQWCVNRLLGPHSKALKGEAEEFLSPNPIESTSAVEEDQDTVAEKLDWKAKVKEARKARRASWKKPADDIPALSERLTGKAGRFRANLLGKRVNFSARSVVVPEPELSLDQCGLPRELAVGMYWPMILSELIRTGKIDAWLAHNRQQGNKFASTLGIILNRLSERIDSDAKVPPSHARGPHYSKLLELRFDLLAGNRRTAIATLARALLLDQDLNDAGAALLAEETPPALDSDPFTLEALDAAVARRPLVLINRQPSLHRPSIQAFEVRLIDGQAIRLHPLVCAGFNADFDGDTVAVHLPLSDRAQQEARGLMMTRVNLLKPASGELLVTPSQDMVLGCYYLTHEPVVTPVTPSVPPLCTLDEVHYLCDNGVLKYHDRVRYAQASRVKPIVTTVGRVLFHGLFPTGTPFLNRSVDKEKLRGLLERVFRDFGPDALVAVLERIKSVGFAAATKGGISLGFDDLVDPDGRAALIRKTSRQVELLPKTVSPTAFSRPMDPGAVNLWLACMEQLKANMKESLRRDVLHGKINPLSLVLDSGARGTAEQIVQIVGMRGVMVRQDQTYANLAIRSSLAEGLTMAEFLTSTVGGRKGLIDSSKRTGDAGYLTRKLVHLMCDVVVTELDCGNTAGAHPLRKAESSVLWCQTKDGVCAKCYGIRLHDAQPVRLGDAVGLIAAQSLGEPTTQLTLRTFHQGGSASGSATGVSAGHHQDITTAVDQITMLLSKFTPPLERWATDEYVTGPGMPGSATRIKRDKKTDRRILKLHPFITREQCETGMAKLVSAVHAIYTSNKVAIHRKHIDLVVREIFHRVQILESWDSGFAEGSIVARWAFDNANDRLTEIGFRPATGRLIPHSINSEKLHAEKPLVAASFSYGTKHLAAAAVKGQTEHLTTIREKVMAGGLIPAGTGYPAKTPVECNGVNG